MKESNFSSWESGAAKFLLTRTGIVLKRRIGEGGAGRTFVGESQPGLPIVSMDKNAIQLLVAREHWPARVCCKLVTPDSKLLACERDGIRRVERIQRRFLHPHLLTLFCFADFDGGFVEVMELADEVSEHSFQTLEHYIWAKTRLALDETYTIIRCLAEAAQHLRNYDRRHQDIKPANVVRVGRVWKLADFGAVIIESQSGVEGRLMREPYGPDTAGLARTLYAMLSGDCLSHPCDPLPEDLLPLGDRLHDELILPAARESESIKSPAQFLARLDRICAAEKVEPDLPPAEHVRKLADGMAEHVSSHNRGVLTTLACTALVSTAVAAVSTVVAMWWLPQIVLLPVLLAAGVAIGTVAWYRRAGEFWTVAGLAQWIDDRSGTSNLVLSALDYACGAESGLARAERQVWLAWSCLDVTVPFQQCLSDVGSRCELGCWSLVPRSLRPQTVDRRLKINNQLRAASARRLIEPTSDFSVSIVRRAERQFAALMSEIPPYRKLFVELRQRWGNRLLGLVVGLLALLILWTTSSPRRPGAGPGGSASSATKQPDQQEPENPDGDAQQSPQDALDKKQVADALRQAEEAFEELSRQATQDALREAGDSSESLDSIEQFIVEARKSLNSSGSTGSSASGSDRSEQASSPNVGTGKSAATAAGASFGQGTANSAASGSQQDDVDALSGGNPDASSSPSGQTPQLSSSPTSNSTGNDKGQSSNPDGLQSANQPSGGKSETSPHGGKQRDSKSKAGLSSDSSQPPGSKSQSGPQRSSGGSQPASATAGGKSALSRQSSASSVGSSGPQSQGMAASAASAADLQNLAKKAAAALQHAHQSLRETVPSSKSQRAAEAAAAAAQALQVVADNGQGNDAGSNSPDGEGGREPGTGSSQDHVGGQAAPLVLDGRVIQIPLTAIRGGDLPPGPATSVNVKPSSLQRRSEGESADAMVVDEHKKRAVNAILAPADATPNTTQPTQP